MPETETDGVDRCGLCAQPCAEVDGGRKELHVQLIRGDDGELLYWAGDFCSQEHAAEWLRRPLPEPMSPSPPPGPTPWSDRLATGGCCALFLVLVACLAIGAWTVVRFLLDHV